MTKKNVIKIRCPKCNYKITVMPVQFIDSKTSKMLSKLSEMASLDLERLINHKKLKDI
jgi:DNA-directed RNA polymerase subunit RPC12/RpoP